MAAVSSAVDSTMCGHPPRCIHMDTRATALCFSFSLSLSLSPLLLLLLPPSSCPGGI
jgi:hypothetical protein